MISHTKHTRTALLTLITILFFALPSPSLAQIPLSLEALDIYHRASLLNYHGKLGYSQTELLDISLDIEHTTKKHNVNQYLMMALFMTESGFGKHLKGVYRGKLIDYGWGQINVVNIKRLDLSIEKLLNDRLYSIEEAAKFMSDVRNRFAKKEPNDYYSRYHSYTPRLRDIYEKKVQKWLKLMHIKEISTTFELKFEAGACKCITITY